MATVTIRTDRTETLTDLTGTRCFTIWEVTPGKSCMAGLTTSGKAGYGRVTAVMPGIGFAVDNGIQPSILWSQFWLLDSEPAWVTERLDTPPAEGLDKGYGLRRTDSGSDYGFVGFPDCEFWAANGMPANYVALPEHYSGYKGDDTPQMKARIRSALEDAEEEGRVPADGPYREAWDRQMADVMTMSVAELEAPMTPPGSPKMRECPGAPARPPRPEPLTLPTVDDHKGRGILPTYFIKPDPILTKMETRAYIRTELTRYLTDCPALISHAKEASLSDDLLFADSNWPAKRLATLAARPELDGGDESYVIAARNALEFCLWWLEHGAVDDDLLLPSHCMALGFVREDRLPDGRTILDLWNRSPFEALRAAPPLPDVEEEAESEEEAEMLTQDSSLRVAEEDAAVEEKPLTVNDILRQKVVIRLPVWGWAALYAGVLSYLWLVAMVVRR